MSSKIAWLVPYPIKGSGGHRTILSHVRNLNDRGHQCHVFIGEDTQQNMEVDALDRLVTEYFGPCPAQIHSGYYVDDKFDLAIATAWWTAEIVAKEVKAEKKVYFVQDFEPCFNPMGDNYILAENSYRENLTPVTIGRWLSRLLQVSYRSSGGYFEFTADCNTYFPDTSISRELAVCFLYQPEKQRRCPQIGRDAMTIVKDQYPEVHIYTYGSEEKPNFFFNHTHLGILSREECNKLYNQCMAGLCISSSNPSRIPFEMMAAGLPAVDFYGENTIFDLPEKGVLLAERNAASLAGALLKILRSTELQEEMSSHGQQFMKDRPAELEFEQFADHIENILAGNVIKEIEISPLYTSRAFSADYQVPSHQAISPPSLDNVEQSKLNLYETFCQNRIGRVLKVLWKGYY